MRLTFLFLSFFLVLNTSAQTDEEVLKSLYKASLTNGNSYQWLDYLSNQIGGRLSGSLNAELTVEYTKLELEKLELDKVWLQPVMVPKWVRGAPEFAFIESALGSTTNVNICALGGSVATPLGGLKAHVVEVKSMEELETLGKENIEGKIVFFNRPMQPDVIHTFEAYGSCANQRYSGALEASKYGAVGVLVRSLSLRQDNRKSTRLNSSHVRISYAVFCLKKKKTKKKETRLITYIIKKYLILLKTQQNHYTTTVHNKLNA